MAVSYHKAVDAVLGDVDKLRRLLKRESTNQVRNKEEKALIKATCLAWFNNYRESIVGMAEERLVKKTDSSFTALMVAADRDSSRSKYDSTLKELRGKLTALRTSAADSVGGEQTTDAPPPFASLVSDPVMQQILHRRWIECGICTRASAPLAATVMMGGLLEALLLARVHREVDKKKVFAAVTAPRDKTGKPQPLQEWTLRHYIDVAHELKWITSSAKDLGAVVRDYRNYIHPHKELVNGVTLEDGDAQLFWEVAKGMARQLLV